LVDSAAAEGNIFLEIFLPAVKGSIVKYVVEFNIN